MTCEKCNGPTEELPPVRDDRLVRPLPTHRFKCLECGHVTLVRGH